MHGFVCQHPVSMGFRKPQVLHCETLVKGRRDFISLTGRFSLMKVILPLQGHLKDIVINSVCM